MGGFVDCWVPECLSVRDTGPGTGKGEDLPLVFLDQIF